MQYTNEQIKNIILEYVMDTRYKQAVLLDGEWGSGKTHFVEKMLIPALKDQLSTDSKSYVVYTSLYGIETTKQLSDEIYSSVMAMIVANKTGGEGSTISKAATIFSKIAITGLSCFVDTSNLPEYSDFSTLKRVILILDDLERCHLHINSVFGFLNNLVEHNDVKIIIVANQNELGKIGLSDDLAQKYSVILHDNYLLEDSQDKGLTKKQLAESKKRVALNDLQKYADTLFSSDVLYDKLKEKLIGFTIKYHANFDASFDTIVENNIKFPHTISFVHGNKDLIIDRFEKEKHYNLRTLIFSLIVFERIHSIIYKLPLASKHLEAVTRSILSYIIAISIYVKEGGQLTKWKDNMHWSIISMHDSLSNYGEAYRFVDEYLMYRIMNEDEITAVVTELVNERTNAERNEQERNSWKCNNLYEWWYLEDDELSKTLDGVYEELCQNKYPYYYYKDIVVSFIQMELSDIKIDIKKYVKVMTDNIRSEHEPLDAERFMAHGEAAIVDKIEVLFAPIIEIVNKNDKSTVSNEINDCFEPLDIWGEKFRTYCKKIRDQMSTEKSFFSAINIDKLYVTLNSSNTRNIYDFIKGIKTVYHFSNLYEFFPNDLEAVKILIERLAEFNTTSKSKQIAFRQLMNVLNESAKNLCPQKLK